VFNEEPYFGGNTIVGQAWNGLSDNDTNINAVGKQAFSSFKSPGIQKRWTLMRPVILTNGSPALLANINVDFATNTPTAPLNFTPTSYATWDAGVWDTSVWGGELNILNNWQGVYGVGVYAAPILQSSSQGIKVHWVSTDLVMERGGIM
jgi:hypothetical protein